MNDWTGITPDPENNYGFVYRLTNTVTGKDYIGRKYYWDKLTRPPLKGRVNKRRGRKASNWLIYLSSSDAVKKDMEIYGVEAFTREILFQGARGDVNYTEAKYQFAEDVLLRNDSYNGQIQIRIGHNAVNNLKETYGH